MPKIQIEYKDEKLDKAIKLHQIRYNFVTKADAIVDMLMRFTSKEDYDFFLQVNEKMPVNEEEPEYVKKIDSKKKKKVRKTKQLSEVQS